MTQAFLRVKVRNIEDWRIGEDEARLEKTVWIEGGGEEWSLCPVAGLYPHAVRI